MNYPGKLLGLKLQNTGLSWCNYFVCPAFTQYYSVGSFHQLNRCVRDAGETKWNNFGQDVVVDSCCLACSVLMQVCHQVV